MIKRWSCMVLAVFLVWINGAATQSVSWSGNADQLDLYYGAQNGCVELMARSPSYTYVFRLDASLLRGHFAGTTSGFLHDFAYLAGIHVSWVDASGVMIQVASRSEAARIIEKLNTTDLAGEISVRIVIKGDKVFLRIEKPKGVEEEEPIVLPPRPMIKVGYIFNDRHEKIGGYFENVGNAVFEGKIEYRAGLSYNRGWIAEGVTDFAQGRSEVVITLRPRERISFYIMENPAGGWTFIFPELIYNDSPMTFSVFPPSPDSKSVEWFYQMIYSWWTGYHDTEPEVDYVNTKIRLRGEGESGEIDVSYLFFFGAINPYFPPPR